MPRDGSGIYVKPFPDVVEGTTIESTVHNGEISDIEYDLNLPRPIVAGGTGANNAHDALINLKGEEALQGPVTNYDTFPFVSGSFYSTGGATGEPVAGQPTSGICYVYGDPAFATLEAHAVAGADTNKYIRLKSSGVWGAWKKQAGSTADLDAAYVNVAGDTMTGNLNISPSSGSAAIQLYKTPGATAASIVAYTGVNARWSMDFGDAAAESTGNAGSDFYLRRYSDAGTQLSLPIGINRATGKMTLGGDIAVSSTTASTSKTTGALTVAGGLGAAGAIIGTHVLAQGGGALWAQDTPTTGQFHFGASGTKYLSFDGASYTFQGGNPLVVQSDITSYRSGVPNTGYYFFGNTGTKYFGYNGVQFTMLGGQLNLQEGMLQIGSGTGTAIIYLGNSGTKYLQFDGTNTRLEAGQLTIGAAPASGGLDIASGTNPSVRFIHGGTLYGSVSDNGGSINVWSNAGQSTGMYIVHGGSAWTGISDARLPYKRDAKPLTVLDKIDGVQLYENIVNERPDLFVKAQEFAKVFPHLVYPGRGDNAIVDSYEPTGGNDPACWGMSYERAGVVALQGLKELKQLVTELRAEIAELKAAR